MTPYSTFDIPYSASDNKKPASFEAGLRLLLGFWFVKQSHANHNNKHYASNYVEKSFVHKLLFAAHRHNKNYGGYSADNNISPENIHKFLDYFARLMLKIMQPIPVIAPPINTGMVIADPVGIKNATTVDARRIFDKSEKYSANKSVWSLFNRIFSIYQYVRDHVNRQAMLIYLPANRLTAQAGWQAGEFIRIKQNRSCERLWESNIVQNSSLPSKIKVAKLADFVKALEVGGFAPPDSWMVSQSPHYATPTANLVYHSHV